jgi:hypothetical protein
MTNSDSQMAPASHQPSRRSTGALSTQLTPSPTGTAFPTREKAVEVSGRVSRLLSHYWTAADPQASRKLQIEDWIEDLIEFNLDVIDEALRDWRRQPGGRRPTPGDIRALCVQEQRRQRERYDAARRPPSPRQQLAEQRAKDNEGRRAEAAERLNQWARTQGFESWDAYLDSGGSHAEAAKRIMASNEPPRMPGSEGNRETRRLQPIDPERDRLPPTNPLVVAALDGLEA